MTLTPSEFAARWGGSSLSERSGAQSHFIDLCDMLGQQHPAASDSVGERYAFEKHVRRICGGKGYADVWMRDHFAWEYKGKHKNLQKAYIQLNDYREDLGNPPLLVICDFDRFEIHTNFNTYKRLYAFDLDDLNRNQVTPTCPLPPIDVLRALFGDVSVLRPERTDAQVTLEAAKLFSRLAERLELEERNLGACREEIAHFLMRLLFCLFADSIGLLPDRIFRKLLQSEDRFNPKRFLRKLTDLFKAMSQPDGIFGEHTIKYFNGGLFDTASIVELDKADLGILYEVSKNYDWSHIAPAIFGTLFERSLDPARRSLIGAHYTSETDILLLIEPVLMRPLEQRWATVRQQVLGALETERIEEAARNGRQGRIRTDLQSQKLLGDWIGELTSVRVLDPACGSGNFLYVALRRMSDLWLEATRFAAEQNISLVIPRMVSPTQLLGIETEFYAHELASIVVWIGFLQWKHEHAIQEDREPVLQKLANIEHADAILRYEAQGNPYEPEWPKADFIIGNPPFVGGNRIRSELGDEYVDDLFKLYAGRVGQFADLVCYWFEKSRVVIMEHPSTRVGLLATQGIRGGVNRDVLNRIKQSGDIFFAISEKQWPLDSAVVRISMIGFDNGNQVDRELNGVLVGAIHANLSTGEDTTTAMSLTENNGICFMGVSPKGPFDISESDARKMLAAPANVNGRSNADVLKPVLSGIDLVGEHRRLWTIDFGTSMSEEDAAHFELPFERVRHRVYPVRQHNNRESYKKKWWLFGEPRPAMRKALREKQRYIATPATAKHRIFTWIDKGALCNQGTLVFARDDDYFFGMLHSFFHEVWALHMCTHLESRPRYTPDSTFDTFPFPWPPGTEPSESEDSRVKVIADTARELVRLRDKWLNSSDIDPKELKRRTLTNLYNTHPAWLANAHEALDRAVFAAYGLAYPLAPNEVLRYLLVLNLERAAGHVRVPTPELPMKKAPGVERLPRQKPSQKIASRSGTR